MFGQPVSTRQKHGTGCPDRRYRKAVLISMTTSYSRYKKRIKSRPWIGTAKEFRDFIESLDESIREERIASIRHNNENRILPEKASEIFHKAVLGNLAEDEIDRGFSSLRWAYTEAKELVPKLRVTSNSAVHIFLGSLANIAEEIIEHSYDKFSLDIPVSHGGLNTITLGVDPGLGIRVTVEHGDRARAQVLVTLVAQFLADHMTIIKKLSTNDSLLAAISAPSLAFAAKLTGFPYGMSLGSFDIFSLIILSVAVSLLGLGLLRKFAPLFHVVDRPAEHVHRKVSTYIFNTTLAAVIGLALAEVFS